MVTLRTWPVVASRIMSGAGELLSLTPLKNPLGVVGKLSGGALGLQAHKLWFNT